MKTDCFSSEHHSEGPNEASGPEAGFTTTGLRNDLKTFPKIYSKCNYQKILEKFLAEHHLANMTWKKRQESVQITFETNQTIYS